MTSSVASLRLVLRLPGTWVQLDPSRPELTDRRIRTFVELSLGRADELAKARADMRQALGLVMTRAEGPAELESTFLCHEIAPGVPTPLSISVFRPAAIHISPVVGTEPGRVVEGFLAALELMGDGEGWEQIVCVDGLAVRRWTITERHLVDGESGTEVRAVSADYWRTVPGTKNLVLVNATSPLTDIAHTVLHLTDAIVAGSRFALTEATEV